MGPLRSFPYGLLAEKGRDDEIPPVHYQTSTCFTPVHALLPSATMSADRENRPGPPRRRPTLPDEWLLAASRRATAEDVVGGTARTPTAMPTQQPLLQAQANEPEQPRVILETFLYQPASEDPPTDASIPIPRDCVICVSAARTVRLNPCGHESLCASCATTLLRRAAPSTRPYS